MNAPLQTITLQLEEPAGIDRKNWPVTRGIPFPPGLLSDPGQLALKDASEKLLPIQIKPLARHPDGSLKWVLLHTQVSVSAESQNEFALEVHAQQALQPVTNRQVSVVQTGEHLSIDTGEIQIEIDHSSGLNLFEKTTRHGKSVLTSNADHGFVIVGADGRRYSSLTGQVTRVEIEEAGPLRAVLFFAGDHRSSDGERLFRYEARLSAYAGHSWMQIDYTFINDSDDEITSLQQVGFEITPATNGEMTGLVGAYTLQHESHAPFSIYQDTGCRYFFFSGSKVFAKDGEHLEFPYAGEMLKKAAHGWMDISSAAGGVTVAVRRMAMLAPKALLFTGPSIDVQLWPARAGLLNFRQGMARTHTITLAFHDHSGQSDHVGQLATCFEEDLALTAPNWMVQSGAFGDLFPYEPRKYPEINIRLRDQFNHFYMTNFALGFFDYGDSLQHAGGARASYMANNEYDLPQVMALMFARTGEREYLEVMEACAQHMMDIDFIHHTTHAPLELGGVRIHGNQHVQYNCEGMPDYSLATSHMWTEGLLSYHFLTGNQMALMRARQIGECLLKLLDDGWALPPYKVEWHSVRDSAWPILALGALYEATREQQWLDACRKIAEAVMQWQKADGSWNLYLGWYNGSFSPLQIGIGITGLARYHMLTGDPRASAAVVRAATAFVEKCVYPEGVLRYINAPGYRWNYYASCILEGLGYAWSLTNDDRFIHIGDRSLYKALSAINTTGTSIAESWRGILRFMYWADVAGFLQDLRPW